jgi:hypothetical protein
MKEDIADVQVACPLVHIAEVQLPFLPYKFRDHTNQQTILPYNDIAILKLANNTSLQ